MKKTTLSVIILTLLLLFSCAHKHPTVKIVENGASDYRIIYPSAFTAEEKQCAALVRSVIEKASGVKLDISDDWEESRGTHEILIGNTNRPSSSRDVEYMCGVFGEENGTVYICGRGEGALTKAASAFLEAVCGYDGSDNVRTTPVIEIEEGVKSEITMIMTTKRPDADGSSYIENGLKSGSLTLTFENGTAVIKKDGPVAVSSERPAIIRVLTGGAEKEYSSEYTSVLKSNSGYTCFAEVKTENESIFTVRDDWFILDGVFCFDRTVGVKSANMKDNGYESVVSFTDSGKYSFGNYEYFIPGTLFRDTEYMQTTNPWGKSLGSDFSQSRNYVKEICVPLPAVMVRNKNTGIAVMLQHLEPVISIENPVADDTVINDDVRYGSVGYGLGENLTLDFVYPSQEGPVTYEHNGSSWRNKYHKVSAGNTQSYTIALQTGAFDSYQEAMTETYLKAFSLENPAVTDTDIANIYKNQIDIYKTFYTESMSKSRFRSCGLYFDASVKTGEPFSPVSYLIGFSGAQASSAYDMYRFGLLNKDTDLKKKGMNMLDFWSSDTINAAALPVVWWTPNNALPDGGQAANYACYLRVFVDGMESLLDAAILGKANGENVSKWSKAALKTADFLVEHQSKDGTWGRAYNRKGYALKSDTDLSHFNSGTIFGGYDGESPLASYCAVRFLYKAYSFTGDEKYKSAALKTAEWAYKTLYTDIGKYVSICPDHVNIVDKESSIYAMYCFSTAYKMTGEQKYLDALRHAAASAMSFVYVYDFAVPYSASGFEGVNVFKNGNVIGQSIIATGYGSVDAYAACCYSDMLEVYALTGNEIFFSFADFIQNNTKLASDWDGTNGWFVPGLSLEACNVNSNIFSTAGDGVWLPWISHAFVDPYQDLCDIFGIGNVKGIAEKYSLEEIRNGFSK